MERIFNFAPPKEGEEATRKTWEEFRNALYNIKTLDEAKEILFLRVFDDIFENNGVKEFFSKKLGKLTREKFYRGAILRKEHNVPLDRFIPKKEFITDDNRFSPPGVEWLYLAISKSSKMARDCCIKECKAKDGDYYGLCKFEVVHTFDEALIVDLTMSLEKTYDTINQEMEQEAQKRAEEQIHAFSKTWDIRYLAGDSDVIGRIVKRWYAQTDAKMMSEQLFVPVIGAEKGKEYLPFQWLARYFKSLGFEGIIYKSVECPGAKNIVLFNKNMAEPVKKAEFWIQT